MDETNNSPQSDMEREGDERVGVDPALQLWVQAANEFGLSVSVTLFVGGVCISGELVSFRRWAETQGEHLKNAQGNLPPGALDAFAGLFDDVSGSDPTYVHLLNARAVTQSPFTLPSWRGRLSAVDGWLLGR